ncbi:MAG: penicillin-binding protein [Mesorhizobium amorphae]|nr:MAG: penicillin-binding protein [Mesorhizobium amorphae]
MARNTRGGRIEPTWDAPARNAPEGLSVRAEDRIVGAPPVSKRRGKAKQASRPRRRSFFSFGRLVYWGAVLGLWALIAVGGVVAFYAAQLPAASTAWTVPDRAPNVRIQAVDGSLLANRGATGGEALRLSEMSPFIPQAVIAIEDRRFHSHWGVDVLGLGRAMVENVSQGRLVQGGSTITQQLAKNLFLKPDRTLGRKVQEALLAVWLEGEHSKDEILEMYLNRVYFGSGAYGVEAASRRYFNKSAREVSLEEAALLAGLLKAPSRLSPARDPDAAESRAQVVLAAMRQEGMIGDSQMAGAFAAPTVSASPFWTGSEQYVADRVMDELPELAGEPREDLVVETTVDLSLQRLAETSIRRLIREKGKELAVSQGALVSIDNTGAVRALVGGADYARSQFDRATEARRQPGSAFKPFVYLAAIEKGETPESVRVDAPVRFGKWKPENYKGKYYGPVSLGFALSESLNSVAAQLAAEVGPAKVAETASRLGIESKLTNNMTLSLGTSEVTPLELTAAYVPFANGGLKPEIHMIDRITTASGTVLYERTPERMPRVVSLEAVGMMNAMMSQTVEEGTGKRAKFGWPAAGKTGTTQNARDAWFVGYTANLTTGVWFGNDDGKPMKNATGGSLPTLAWHKFMAAAHQGVTVAGLPGEWHPGLAQEAAPVLPASNAEGNDGWNLDGPPPPDGPTSSVGHPVPPADVGGPKKKPGSLLDLILGN